MKSRNGRTVSLYLAFPLIRTFTNSIPDTGSGVSSAGYIVGESATFTSSISAGAAPTASNW